MDYKIVLFITINVALSFLCSSSAFTPIPLQDFCVAYHNSTTAKINGMPCKDPSTVTVDNFFFSGLNKAGNTPNLMGSAETFVSVNQIPGLNTQNIIIGRADYAPNGYISPHYHPRATEVIIALEGTLEVGFVTSFPKFVQFNKTLNPGDVFLVPHGLIHYQYNVGARNAAVLLAFNSQSPAVSVVTNNIFQAKPEINPDFLAAAFQLDKKTIQDLQERF